MEHGGDSKNEMHQVHRRPGIAQCGAADILKLSDDLEQVLVQFPARVHRIGPIALVVYERTLATGVPDLPGNG